MFTCQTCPRSNYLRVFCKIEAMMVVGSPRIETTESLQDSAQKIHEPEEVIIFINLLKGLKLILSRFPLKMRVPQRKDQNSQRVWYSRRMRKRREGSGDLSIKQLKRESVLTQDIHHLTTKIPYQRSNIYLPLEDTQLLQKESIPEFGRLHQWSPKRSNAKWFSQFNPISNQSMTVLTETNNFHHLTCLWMKTMEL